MPGGNNELGKEFTMLRPLHFIVLIAACVFCGLSFGHTGVGHYREFSIVFNGYGDEGFKELCESISKGVDTDLPEAFRKAIGSVPGNHRVLGHGWTLDAPIPKETLKFLETTFPGKRGEIIEVWSQHVKRVKELARSITGLAPAQADAFAAMLHDIHLLGDLEPGNVVTKYVLSPKEISKHFSKQCRILFRNRPEFAHAIEKSLKNVTRLKLTDDVMARAIIDALAECKVGDKLHLAHPGMKISYSDKWVKSADRKVVSRLFERVPGAGDSTEGKMCRRSHLSKKDFAKSTEINPNKSSRVLAPGLLAADGRLLVSLKTGVSDGLIVFAIEGGIATYSYAKGNINNPEYQEKLVDAAIKGASVGSAVAVSVLLGAGPGGWVVLAVGIGAYEISDFAVSTWRMSQKRKYLTFADLEPFGIVSETTLDLKLDTTLDLKPETTLDLKLDTTLDLKPETTLDL